MILKDTGVNGTLKARFTGEGVGSSDPASCNLASINFFSNWASLSSSSSTLTLIAVTASSLISSLTLAFSAFFSSMASFRFPLNVFPDMFSSLSPPPASSKSVISFLGTAFFVSASCSFELRSLTVALRLAISSCILASNVSLSCESCLTWISSTVLSLVSSFSCPSKALDKDSVCTDFLSCSSPSAASEHSVFRSFIIAS
mmetsp:Transcript_50600/g.90394  ORF Transcript_50600/g.90394 Transcript_50600/m.90394 type:complete len:201 (+) Transcript_50600:821-1423(+)